MHKLKFKLLIAFLFLIGGLLFQTKSYAFRVFPTTAQTDKMFDKANFPFIAENADGFNLQHDSFGPFSADQVETIFNQFTNKNFINHGVFKTDVQITNMSTMQKKPSFANVTAMMLYNEAPAMDAEEWASALSQNCPWPLITHCRSFAHTSSFNELKRQIRISSGCMFEFQVTKPEKYDDVAEMIKYCVDNDRMAVLLTTFQESPKVFISAYKEFFYYLKENLDPKYLESDHLIFVPNTYEDSQVFPETLGYGSTFGIAHWLIDQKSKVNDGYIQPKLSFLTPKHGSFFENHKDLTVGVGVSSTGISGVKLFVNDSLVGEDTSYPYSWSGGLLSDLTTGYQELRAVVVDDTGIETEKVIRINILKDPPSIPGFFQASELSNYQLRNDPDPDGYIRHVYGQEWIDYKLDVKHSGLYDVKVDLKVQRSKQYGGTIIIKKGTKELGRFTTVVNDPDKAPLTGFTENPNAIIKNVELSKGLQSLRVTFSHPNGGVKPQFYLYSFNFMKQGAPDIVISTPEQTLNGEYGSYSEPANVKLSADITSPRDGGKVKQARLYVNDTLISTLSEAPFQWNVLQEIPALSGMTHGDYNFKIEAIDDLGYTSFKELPLSVIARKPFNLNLSIPGTISAYHFDLGGEGIGYHENNDAIERGLGGAQNPRYSKAGNESVEIDRAGSDYVVSAIRNDEWLNYTISNVKKGVYKLLMNVSANAGKSADVLIWLNNKHIGTLKTGSTSKSGFNVYKNFIVQDIEIPEDMLNAQLRLEFINPDISVYLMFFKRIQFIKTGEVSSLKDISLGQSLQVYPNPTSTSFTIELSDSKSDISIYNLSGKLMYQKKSASGRLRLNSDMLQKSGTYFIYVLSKDKGVQVQKLVVL